jgi:hypothetical protein
MELNSSWIEDLTKGKQSKIIWKFGQLLSRLTHICFPDKIRQFVSVLKRCWYSKSALRSKRENYLSLIVSAGCK